MFQRDNKIAAVQPKILSYSNPEYFEFAGAAGGLIDNLGYPYCRGRIFDETEHDEGQYDAETEIMWASGCCFFIRAEEFRNQGGFDERFFAHQEEIDLCWRLRNAGKQIWYTPEATVYHVGGGTLDVKNPRKTYLNFRNNLCMMLKNLPFPQLLWIIFLRLCLDGLAGIHLGLKYGLPHLWAVVRAHFSFYAAIPGTLKRRGDYQSANYFQTKWLVFRHFLKS